MSESLKDIRSIAIQMEMDGIRLYSDLAEKTLHPMGKAMFKSFVEDERMHARRLRALLPSEEEPIEIKEKEDISPRERLVSVFREMGDEIKKKVTPCTNDIDAVRLAMEIEEKGIKFYEQAGKEAANEREYETFHFLAMEEKTHLNILQNTLEYLENMELWEAEKEGRIYDLWMSKIHKTYDR